MKQVFYLFFLSAFFPVLLTAQDQDTTDRINKGVEQSAVMQDTSTQQANLPSYYSNNKILNTTGIPVSMLAAVKHKKEKDLLFYLLAGLVLSLAFFRYFFTRYFSNLFRVFFNTSLRQSQLTDQLLQAKLPSLILNIFFIFTGGIYVYTLLQYNGWIPVHNNWLTLGICTGTLGLIYFIKFCTLKFTGWLTGYASIINTYVFIIFLICKIIGILLVPFIILITFSDAAIVHAAILISLLLIGMMFILRFLRSYSIIQNQLKVSKIHFILYILGIEILPLLLIYKGLMVLLTNKL